MAALKTLAARATRAVDAALGAYAQILFARSRVVGALVALATFTDPAAGALGVAGLAAAGAATRGLGVDAETSGAPYGPNALLVALGVAHAFGTTPGAGALAIGASAASVVVTASLASLSTRVGGLPILSVPFVLVTWLVQGLIAGRSLLPPAPAEIPPPAFDVAPLEGLLAGVGSLLFAPRALAGGLVLAALLVHSRIGALLAAVGVAAVVPVAGGELAAPMALNAALAATGLGGVWFVPSWSAFAIAGVGAVLAAAITAAIAPPLAAVGLTPLILPFAVAVGVVLLAMRQRVADRHPKSVDFAPGTPEANLAYYRMRVARFRAPYAVPFRLPFRGAWVCTQGVDGPLTHQAAWRHAFDFEVANEDGATFRGDGAELQDHHCFKLPVLATADGVVVEVENEVPDNAIGHVELTRNWGNVVVLQHGAGLFSLVAHLARGSVKVREGQSVRRGDVLGACGSSGRSPRPHLHFQLQGSAALGAPTLPCRFADAVFRRADGSVLDASALPGERDVVRNVEPDEAMAASFAFEPGTVLALESHGRVEHVECDLDLYGHRVLRSREHGAVLYFGRAEDGLTTYDVVGERASVLHLVRAALGRVPFDAEGPAWRDFLPVRWTGWAIVQPLRDLVAPFVPSAGLAIEYRAHREPTGVRVEGASVRNRRGAPTVRTSATVSFARGLESLEVRSGARTWRAARVEPLPRASSDRPPAPRRAAVARVLERLSFRSPRLGVRAGSHEHTELMKCAPASPPVRAGETS